MTSDAADWDAMYAERGSIWSGEPNAQLVAEVTTMTPGTALDVGCGEGADAVWLAQRGWDVTAVDLSGVALERARGHASAAGVEIAFERADLVAAPPPPGGYDLVSAQFFHLPDPPRSQAYRGLGAAVAPGGHLLVVGHYPSAHIGKDHPERLFTIDEVVALFPGWQVVTAEIRERTAMHHGELSDLVDGVVLLRRDG
ncbi:class I SAM-dependent methyltransferase [Aeromicrobium ginsengisoli]|uniref:Class I SAM-dependent methyltransferase n=1 Tax=Aeromicrobium ginsengisoli TaxID=363867 RepID=A0A5M4FGP2_9ACTN|nr:class I SAM-dependent methyltransferase [Aeromicrobium ginsengisoli]KAA1399389.1 class I SAM-dependent methyltransferase [Aeromicrobium ginsengisoli]